MEVGVFYAHRLLSRGVMCPTGVSTIKVHFFSQVFFHEDFCPFLTSDGVLQS